MDSLAKELRISGSEMRSPKSYTEVITDGFVICYSSSEFPLHGCFKYSSVLAIEWISRFFMKKERKLYTIIELPSSFIRCMTTKDYCPQLRNYISEQMLREESPDKDFWDVAEGLFTSSDDMVNLLFLDSHHYLATSSMADKGVMEVRVRDMNKKTRDKTIIGGANNSQITTLGFINNSADSVRLFSILYASYIYFTYRISRSINLTKLESVFPRLPTLKNSIISRLFPLLLQLLNADTLNPYHLPLAKFYKECTELMNNISRCAEEIRQFCQHPNDPMVIRKMAHLVHIYKQTSAINEVINTYKEIRQQIALEHKVDRLTRWVYLGTTEIQRTTELIHSMSREIVDSEAGELYNWFHKISSSPIKPNYALIISGEFDLIETPNPEQHFLDLNHEYVVLRFGQGVRHYEINMTLDYFAQSYPKLFQCSKLPGLTSGDGDCRYQSQVWYCSCDFSGPFVVIRRHYLQMLRQIMLVTTLKTEKYNKNMPIFPILARLYFLEHPIDAITKENQQESLYATNQILNPLIPSQFKNSHDNYAKDFSLFCALQIISYWLQVEPEKKTISNTRETNLGKRKLDEINSNGSLIHTSDAYVPNIEDEFFPCMYFLHRLPDQLREGFPRGQTFPDLPTMNAIRDFIEIKKPRQIKINALKILAENILLCQSRPNCKERHQNLLWVIDSLINTASPKANLQNNSLSAENTTKKSKQELSDKDANKSENQYCMFVFDEHMKQYLSDKPEDVLCKLNEDQRTPMMNWFFYAPFLSGDIPPEITYEILCTQDNVITESKPLTESSFDNKKYFFYLVGRWQNDPLTDYWQMYDKCFVTPYPLAASGTRLPDRFAENNEPMDAFISFIKSLEMRVSGKSMAGVLSKVTIDVDSFLGENSLDKSLVPNRTSMLPIQAHISGGNHSEPENFTFFESSFATICIRGIDCEKKQNSAVNMPAEHFFSMGTGPASDLAIDLICRFRDRISLENVCQERGQERRYNQFKEELQQKEKEECSFQNYNSHRANNVIDASNRHFFNSFEEVERFVRHKLNPEKTETQSSANQNYISDFSVDEKLTKWIFNQLPFVNNLPKNTYGLVDSGSFLVDSASLVARYRKEEENRRLADAMAASNQQQQRSLGLRSAPPPQILPKTISLQERRKVMGLKPVTNNK